MSGSVAVFSLDENGAACPRRQFFQYEGSSVNRARQNSPHAHSLVFDRAQRRAFVPDLGTDRLMRYAVDPATGLLTPDGFFPLDAGSGPRHCEFSRGGDVCYLIKELTSEITVLAYDAETGIFTHRQNISTVASRRSAVPNTCADLHLSADGRFLYGSNRGENTIVCFAVEPDTGLLRTVGSYDCGGEVPRSFAVDPKGGYVLSANQDTDNIVVFRAEAETGALEKVSEISVPTPVCVRFRT